jgi:hypothetical protein
MTPLGGFSTKKSQNVVSPRSLKATTVQLGHVIKQTDKSTRHQLLLNAEKTLMGLDISDLLRLWNLCDVNGNGLVSQSELENFVSKHFPELDWKARISSPSHRSLSPLFLFRFPAASRSYLQTNPRMSSFPKRSSERCSSLCYGPISSNSRSYHFAFLCAADVYNHRRAFEALSFADDDQNRSISFDEWRVALHRLGFSMNDDSERALFQTCSRGHLGLMFGEFCAWCVQLSFPLFSLSMLHVAMPLSHTHLRRYVSSQLESVSASKLGPLNLLSNRKSLAAPKRNQPLNADPKEQPKPRGRSADGGRLTPSGDGGEKAPKHSREREVASGTDKDKLQAIYSSAPRTKHNSLWTKENLLRSGTRTQEVESGKDTRASVSHDIRQVLFVKLLVPTHQMVSDHPTAGFHILYAVIRCSS